MDTMLSNLKEIIDCLCQKVPITAQWCGVVAHKTGLKRHKDSRLIPFVLAMALIELFLSVGVQEGTPNSFKIGQIHQYYESSLERENKARKEKGKLPFPSIKKEGLMYYLKKGAFALFAECLRDRVREHVNTNLFSCNMLIEGELLIGAFNLLLGHEIEDIIANDGCYKVVDDNLSDVFKGARTAKKPQQNEEGTSTKPKNAQLGQQTSFSIIHQIALSETLSSGVANERDFIDIIPNAIYTQDAGYLQFCLFNKFDQQGSYLVVRGKNNMSGNVLSIKIDGVDKTQELGRGDSLKSPKMQSLPLDQTVDMQVLVSYDKGRKSREVRVIRIEDEKNEGQAAFIVTNLPMSVPASVVLHIMRLRWCIELYFKELKSCTRYRAGVTSSEHLTVGLSYFSIIAHLLRELFVQVIERFFGVTLSLRKLCDSVVNHNGENLSLSLLMGKLMIGSYNFNESLEASAQQAVLNKLDGNGIKAFKKSTQSKKNKPRTFDARVANIVRDAIEANPLDKSAQSLKEKLRSFIFNRGIASVVNPL